jgi:hypothetical protein
MGVPHNWWQARKMTNASSAGLIPSPELQVQVTWLQAHVRGTTTCTAKTIYTGNSKQMSPNFHICVSVSDLYIPPIGLPILLQENMWTDCGNI